MDPTGAQAINPAAVAEGLFSIREPEFPHRGDQLAGEPPMGDLPGDPPATPKRPEIGDHPPQVSDERPSRREVRMGEVRTVAAWIGRLGLVGNVIQGVYNNVTWLQSYSDVLRTYNDPPQTLQELQSHVGEGRPGYDDHHIVEQAWAERFGFSRAEIDDPSNLVSIPRMRHWDITGWYGRPNDDFGELSPRDYLRDKSWDERRRVGIRALIDAGVLLP